MSLIQFKFGKFEVLCIGVVVSVVVLYMRGMFLPDLFSSEKKTICLKELLVASIEAAERGGQMVANVKEGKDLHMESKGKTLEGVNDPVTLGDMLSHHQIFYSITKMWSNLHVVSEEKDEKIPDTSDIKPIDLNTDEITKKIGSSLSTDVNIDDITVWIDPLDATKEYTEDLLQYVTTMVCVAHRGEPIIGVIHRPFMKQTVWAWVGHGRSEIPEFQTNIKDVHESNMKVIVSLSHAGKVKPLAEKAFGSDVEVISAGGAGYKALYVAQRKANAYIHTTAIKKWDICAGNALLRTTGGKMTDLNGNDVDYSFPDADRKNVKLQDGLLGTFKNHDEVLKKLNDVRNKAK